MRSVSSTGFRGGAVGGGAATAHDRQRLEDGVGFAFGCFAAHAVRHEVNDEFVTRRLKCADGVSCAGFARSAVQEDERGIGLERDLGADFAVNPEEFSGDHVTTIRFQGGAPEFDDGFGKSVFHAAAIHRVIVQRFEFGDVIPDRNAFATAEVEHQRTFGVRLQGVQEFGKRVCHRRDPFPCIDGYQ
ncbi:MAG: hypothetical protein HC933_04890 [Pleurocapsa sp. SU_196_0]|nr:hypothetical protein [Pleurocapsa sp. SU_196_0]